jgi:IS605 OrfB family transposase
VDFAVKHGVGTIHLENLSGFGKSDASKAYILRNWSYFQFQTMIKYKAKLEGITVKFVRAAYTSRRCCFCGHVEKKSRDSTSFRCVKCGYALHADLNGAINIGKSKEFCDAPTVEEEVQEEALDISMNV